MKPLRTSLVMFLAICLVASGSVAQAQISLEATLTASDFEDNDQFGHAVALEGDTAVIGVVSDDDFGSGSGAAFVFTRSAGVWTEQQKLTASDAEPAGFFGSAVAIDGDTMVIGANGQGVDFTGAAYVFTRSAGLWTEQAKLTALGAVPLDNQQFFASAVAISGDTVVVGAHRHDEPFLNAGAAYVYVRSSGVWTQQQELRASDAFKGQFGVDVAIDGDTALIGAYADGSQENMGAAYVFTRTGVIWTEQQKLVQAVRKKQDRFGSSVELEGDTALIGADGDDVGGLNLRSSPI